MDKNKSTILVDMDSILVDMMGPLLKTYNERFDDVLTLDNITDWDLHNFTKNNTKEIYKIIEEPGFYLNLPDLPGAIDALKVLNDKANVIIVSASPGPFGFTEKAFWLVKHAPFLTKRQIIFAHEKHLIKAHVLIDDSPHNAKRALMEGNIDYIVGIQYPYNWNCYYYNFLGCSYIDTKSAWADILTDLEHKRYI